MTLQMRPRAIHAVFSSALASSSVPTPQATPLIAQGSFGYSQTVPTDFEALEDVAAERIHWERAWHVATSFLSDQIHGSAAKPSADVAEAIRYLRTPESVGYQLRKGSQADDLLWWYSQAVHSHFLKHSGPELQKMTQSLNDDPISWHPFRRTLVRRYEEVINPLRTYLLLGVHIVERDYRALVVRYLGGCIRPHVYRFIEGQAAVALGLALPERTVQAVNLMEGVESFDSEPDMSALLTATLSDLVRGGFETAMCQRELAVALDSVLRKHVDQACTRRWSSPSHVAEELQAWVYGPFASLAGKTLTAVRPGVSGPGTSVSSADILAWYRSALHELAMLRLKELFDMVVEWDSDSRGGIEDLKHYVTTPQARVHVVNHFTDTLSHRLLQPGASTTEILQIYIRIIKAFSVLDSRLVVLDRVARPIRRYLRDRDDTVRNIVTGLLADPGDPDPSAEVLSELALELHSMDETATDEDDAEYDWDDMNWMPNPADAEPEFKKSKGLDVIGNLISLFENKDIFVREFQTILGERLLSADVDFGREIRVLELLKGRFGEAALQGCEVMLKDIFDSRRTDVLIKEEQQLEGLGDGGQPDIYAKILSRFFWPSLREETFRLPPDIERLQERYSKGFEEHKLQRKLAWLPALGQVTVELQLEDRIISELVTTWQASVIYAFQETGNGNETLQKTAVQLVEELEMDEDLVVNALTFWVSKLVLYQPQPGMYQVLESLPNEEATNSAAGEQEAAVDIVTAAQTATAAAAASAASAIKSEEELAEERMEVMWQYVVGMLTNQGPMPLQQMVMMLNFVVPGGFTHSNEEFRSFLQRRVDDGKLEMAGAAYKIPKK